MGHFCINLSSNLIHISYAVISRSPGCCEWRSCFVDSHVRHRPPAWSCRYLFHTAYLCVLDCSTVGGLRSFVFLKLARYWLRWNQNCSGNFERTKIRRATFSLVLNDLSAGQFFSNSWDSLWKFTEKIFAIVIMFDDWLELLAHLAV